MKLKNDKHETFCNEYIIDLNGTQAAIRAGYSEKTARVTAAKLLAKVNIKDRIAQIMAEREKRTEITQDRVLQEYSKIAFADIKDFVEFKTAKSIVGQDTDGEDIIDWRIVLAVKDSEDVDGGVISEVSISKDGTFKFKLHDKMNALDKLGKHLGMFKGDIISDGGEEINKNLVALAQILQKPQQPHVIESDSSERKD